PRRIDDGLLENHVRAGRVGLFKSDEDCAADHGLAGCGVDDRSADARRIGRDLPGGQHRLQTILAIAFYDDGGAGVEADVDVDVLGGVYDDGATDHLPGGNLQAGVGLARKV